MARVDHQQVLVRLRAHIASKPNHGQRELLAIMASLEADAMMDEGAYQSFLARFGEEVEDAVFAVLPDPDADLIPASAASRARTPEQHRPPLARPGHDDEGAPPWKQQQQPARV